MKRFTPACAHGFQHVDRRGRPAACASKGSRTERGTLGIAASWKTNSAPSTARRQTASSATSPSSHS